MVVRDPYDSQVVFDDLYGDAPPTVLDPGRTVFAILREAKRSRLPPPPMKVQALGSDPTGHSFRLEGLPPDLPRRDLPPLELIGEELQLPLFSALRNKFASAAPTPKAVRLDDEDSYNDFREERRAPYLAVLEARLTALENAFQQHLQHHQEVLGDAVTDAAGQAYHGGMPIRLPLPQCDDGKIYCWQDGGEILVTIRFLDPNGNTALATTGTPLEDAAQEVLGCAARVGADPDEILVVGPLLLQTLGATTLIPQLCKVAPQLAGVRAPFVGVMASESDPEIAAAMTLIQCCQQGDSQACTEVVDMAQSERCSLLQDAGERLVAAQLQKAAGRLS